MIYFIQEEDSCYIKIGYVTSSPFDRLNALQTGNCRTLSIIGLVPGDRKKEQSWHREYNKYRVKDKSGGREWFELPQDMIKSIKTNNSNKYPDLWRKASTNCKSMIGRRKSSLKIFQDSLIEMGFDPINKMDNEQLYNADKYISSLGSAEKTIEIDVKGKKILIES